MNPLISIIVPDSLKNCAPNLILFLTSLAENPDIELLFVSKSEAPTRAERLNIGFEKAQANLILFQHPRSWLGSDAVKLLLKLAQNDQVIWGGFTHSFDEKHWLLKFTSWYSNNIRAARGIIYLDHCIYFHRKMWTQRIPNVAIFEDTILCKNFLKIQKPIMQTQISITSAIRFKKNGILHQSLLNQLLKIAFYFRLPHQFINAIYEKGLRLNDGPPK